MILEKIIEFGPSNKLVGVVSYPEKTDTTKPAIVILNSGVMHHVGACRSAVVIARLFASAGYPVLRFNYYGIGYSGYGDTSVRSPLDIKQEIPLALNELSKLTGVKSFVLHGLCSGARDAFSAALSDERIIAISQIDSHAYRNIHFYLNKIPRFMTNPMLWLNAIKVRLPKKSSPPTQNKASPQMEVQAWPDYPPKRNVESGYQKLTARNVKLLITYTGSWNDEYNYENQFFDMYSNTDFKNLVTINYMPQANHVMTGHGDRHYFNNHFLNFVKSL